MDQPGNIKVSVVVPTCSRPEDLQKCLGRLADQMNGGMHSMELLVCNDSIDSISHSALQGLPNARVINGPRRGPAANRNAGATAAQGEWLIFLDDDCLPDQNLLERYKAAIAAHPDLSVFEGSIAAERPRAHPFEEAPLNERGGNLWSCNFCIRRSLFLELGGFDERFPAPAGEDAELRYRIGKAGQRILFVPEANVVHAWRRRSALGYLRQQKNLRTADLIAMSIHPELRHFFTPWNVAKDIVRYYVRLFWHDFRTMGALAVLACHPFQLWAQFRRMAAYAGCHLRHIGS